MEGIYKILVIPRRPRLAITIAQVVAQFKADVGHTLSARVIEQVCVALGHGYRQRILDPVTTVHAFSVQVLHGNTACTNVPHLTGIAFSAAGRAEPRVVKRRPKQYPRRTKPRDQLRKALLKKKVRAPENIT